MDEIANNGVLFLSERPERLPPNPYPSCGSTMILVALDEDAGSDQ
jgi:hypothetical protein